MNQPFPLTRKPLAHELDVAGCCYVAATTSSPYGDVWEWLYGEPVLDHGTHWLPYNVGSLPARVV